MRRRDNASGARDGAAREPQTPSRRSSVAREGSRSFSEVPDPESFDYYCPLCGKRKGNAAYKHGRFGWEWFVGCWGAACRALGGRYLTEVALAVGAPSGADIKDSPIEWLAGHAAGVVGRGTKSPDSIPSEAKLHGWSENLMSTPEARMWLRRRGISLKTIRAYRLGFDGRAIVVPISDEVGRVVNVHRRYLDPADGPRGKKCKVLTGRGSQLYPFIPRQGPILLCEGMLDALLAIQRGLPAVTTTCGRQLPEPLAGQLADRWVAVAFDVGAEDFAERAAERLRDAGAAEAWVVSLDMPEDGEDLTDWFVKYGRSATRLRRALNLARKAPRDHTNLAHVSTREGLGVTAR